MRIYSLLLLSLVSFLPTPVGQQPRFGHDLLGAPVARLFERLGPPTLGRGTAALVSWSWLDDAGGTITFAVHERMVVWVDSSRARGEITPKPMPAVGPFAGQPIAALLAQKGNPSHAGCLIQHLDPPHPSPNRSIDADAYLTYGKERWLVSAGYVLGPYPNEPPQGGPR